MMRLQSSSPEKAALAIFFIMFKVNMHCTNEHIEFALYISNWNPNSCII